MVVSDNIERFRASLRTKEDINEMKEEENKYLLMGFLEFAIIATLMTLFFPWSLLFCLIFLGMTETKLLLAALLHDFVKTVLAVLGVLVVVVGTIVLLFVLLS
jgi:hypothetical protein